MYNKVSYDKGPMFYVNMESYYYYILLQFIQPEEASVGDPKTSFFLGNKNIKGITPPSQKKPSYS